MSSKQQPHQDRVSPLKQAATGQAARKDYESKPDQDKSRFLLWMVNNANGVKVYRYSRWRGEKDENCDWLKEINRLLKYACDNMGYFDQCVFYRNLRKGQYKNEALPPNEEMFLFTPDGQVYYSDQVMHKDTRQRKYADFWPQYIETMKGDLKVYLERNQAEMRKQGLLGPKVAHRAPAPEFPAPSAAPRSSEAS